MPASLIRKLFRGWTRGESFWDAQGMNENLRVLGDHFPLNVKHIGLPKPPSASEGDCWINLDTGEYSVWSTGPSGEAPSWNNYPAQESLVVYSPISGKLYCNTGISWITPIDSSAGLDAFD